MAERSRSGHAASRGGGFDRARVFAEQRGAERSERRGAARRGAAGRSGGGGGARVRDWWSSWAETRRYIERGIWAAPACGPIG